jgi:hypothetical protein
MAKSSNGGPTKGPGDETKARRAPARRNASKKPTGEQVASAPDLVRSASAAQPQAVATAGATDRASRNSATAPSPEEVRRRAYELYMRRGGTHGGDKDDWFEAERELQNRTH